MQKKVVCSFFIFMSYLLVLSGCSRRNLFFRRKLYFSQVCKHAEEHFEEQGCENMLTVWIHGGRPLKDNNYNIGLKKVSAFNESDRMARIALTLIRADGQMFPEQNFYIYSWPGTMDFNKRQIAADQLCTYLTNLTKDYDTQYKCKPKIRIIAHSHGGNVALNMANNPKSPSIDELILLATPVQTKNKHLIHSPLFKRIISLYSTVDVAQVIDPQLLYADSGADFLFSGQRFDADPRLLQVKVKINGVACLHLQFNDPSTLYYMPSMLKELNSWFDEINPDIKTDQDARFLLSVYTNNRQIPKGKLRTSEHREIVLPAQLF